MLLLLLFMLLLLLDALPKRQIQTSPLWDENLVLWHHELYELKLHSNLNIKSDFQESSQFSTSLC